MLGTPYTIAYGASKGAVRQMTKSVAIDCARKGLGIRCNSVHPGPVETAMGYEAVPETVRAERFAGIPECAGAGGGSKNDLHANLEIEAIKIICEIQCGR